MKIKLYTSSSTRSTFATALMAGKTDLVSYLRRQEKLIIQVDPDLNLAKRIYFPNCLNLYMSVLVLLPRETFA